MALALAAGLAAGVCLLIPGARVAGLLLGAAGLACVGLAAAARVERDMTEEADDFLSGFEPPHPQGPENDPGRGRRGQ